MISADRAPTPLVALLEQELLGTGLRVVEREAIQKVLAEHELDLSGHIEGEGTRLFVELGRLLRADLLVLLKTRPTEKKPLIEITFVETRHGFRLGSHTLVADDQVEQSTKVLARRTLSYAQRVQQGFRYVCAVPPFQSDDLLYDVGHLKKSLARGVQSILEDEPGLMIADLENANAIARELAVSAGPGQIERPLPWYIRGRYRHPRAGQDDNLDLCLELWRGEERLAATERKDLTRDAVQGFLHAAALEFCKTITARPTTTTMPSVSDSRLEVDLLEQQARAFTEAGEWQEVIELSEAGLLLDPARIQLHLRIFEATHFLMIDLGSYRDRRSAIDNARQRFSRGILPVQRREYALLGLEHLAAFLHGGLLPLEEHMHVADFWLAVEIANYSWANDPDRIRDLQRRICFEKKAIILYILNEHRLAPNYSLKQFASYSSLVEDTYMQYSPLTREEKREGLYELLVALGRYPGSIREQWKTLRAASGQGAERDEEFLARLERVPELRPLVALARIANQARDKADSDGAVAEIGSLLSKFGLSGVDPKLFLSNPRPLWRPPASRPAPPGQQPVFTRLTWLDDLRVFPAGCSCQGWFVCRPGLEVLYSCDKVFLMRQPGVLTPLPLILGPDCHEIDRVRYDGGFLWVAMRGQDQHVWIFDPDQLTCLGTIGAADGLPPTTEAAKLAPLGPGRVWMAGGFGRGWVAELSFTPGASTDNATRVNVFFQAREFSDVASEKWRSDPQTAFTPLDLQTFGKSGGSQFVLLSRMSSTDWRVLPPLVFDTATRSLQHVPQGDKIKVAISAADGFYARVQTRYGWHLCRLPDLEPKQLPGFETLDPNQYADGILLNDGRLHRLGWEWVITDFTRGKIISLPIPQEVGFSALVDSPTYGFVAYGWHGAWQARLPESLQRETQDKHP